MIPAHRAARDKTTPGALIASGNGNSLITLKGQLFTLEVSITGQGDALPS